MKDCEYFRGALYADKFYASEAPDLITELPIDEGTPVIRNITFKNLVLDTLGGNAIYLSGLPESPIENITLENITALGNQGIKIYHTKNVVQKNLHVFDRT